MVFDLFRRTDDVDVLVVCLHGTDVPPLQANHRGTPPPRRSRSSLNNTHKVKRFAMMIITYSLNTDEHGFLFIFDELLLRFNLRDHRLLFIFAQLINLTFEPTLNLVDTVHLAAVDLVS